LISEHACARRTAAFAIARAFQPQIELIWSNGSAGKQPKTRKQGESEFHSSLLTT
jgi:hypothetical protein